MIWRWITALRREDRAQDLIEYTLLIGFLALAAIGVFAGSGGSLKSIWTSGSATIAAANSTAVTTATATPPSTGHGDGGHGDGDHGDHRDGH